VAFVGFYLSVLEGGRFRGEGEEEGSRVVVWVYSTQRGSGVIGQPLVLQYKGLVVRRQWHCLALCAAYKLTATGAMGLTNWEEERQDGVMRLGGGVIVAGFHVCTGQGCQYVLVAVIVRIPDVTRIFLPVI
jgi:hypothetical protein